MHTVPLPHIVSHWQVIPCQIKNLQGLMYAMDFLASDTVASVKRKVWEKDGLPSNVQKLVCEGQAMDDAKTLADYHLVKGSVIDVVCGTGDA